MNLAVHAVVHRSRSSRAVLAVTGIVILITLWLPFSQLAGLLALMQLSPPI